MFLIINFKSFKIWQKIIEKVPPQVVYSEKHGILQIIQTQEITCHQQGKLCRIQSAWRFRRRLMFSVTQTDFLSQYKVRTRSRKRQCLQWSRMVTLTIHFQSTCKHNKKMILICPLTKAPDLKWRRNLSQIIRCLNQSNLQIMTQSSLDMTLMLFQISTIQEIQISN